MTFSMKTLDRKKRIGRKKNKVSISKKSLSLKVFIRKLCVSLVWKLLLSVNSDENILGFASPALSSTPPKATELLHTAVHGRFDS